MASQFLPVLITLGVALVTGVGMIAFAALVSQRSRSKSPMKGEVYESGVPELEGAHKRISVKFYLVALVFVVLDVEVAFLYPWALSFRRVAEQAPWIALADMAFFVLLLAMIYGWLWKDGVFDWGRRRVEKPTESE